MWSVIQRSGACLLVTVALGFLTAQLEASQQPPGLHTSLGDANSLYYCFQGKVPETRMVVVDKSRQRIMVFNYEGRFVLEYEFACATGSQPGNKLSEGDERTPEGIYFTTHRYQDRKVTIFGDRAIHINFPNPFDRVAGRKGNGIYIHGTNQKFRPRSTNGCVVLRNQDLARLYSLIKEQVTPVVVVNRLKFADLNQRIKACDYMLKLESAPFGQAQAMIVDHLALNSPLPNNKDNFTELGPRLAAFRKGGGSPVKSINRGMILLGLGDQWVLLADQLLRGKKKKALKVVRRFYLKGADPTKAKVVQGHWIVANTASAKRLASWTPKTVKLARAKPSSPKGFPREQNIHKMLAAWLKAWQNKQLRRYLRFYAPKFKGDGMNRRAWGRRKAYLNRAYKVIRVKAEDVKITLNGSRAKVTFKQTYRSDWHRDVGRKELRLVLIKGNWRIQAEKWEELKELKKASR